MIDRDQIIIAIPRSLEISIYLIIAYLILRGIMRKKKSNEVDKTQDLKYAFFYVFLFWGLSILMELLFNLIALLSFSQDFINSFSTYPQTFVGYDTRYPSLFVANIIRDLQGVFAISSSYFTFRSIKIIQFGSQKGISDSKKIYVLIFYAVLMALFVGIEFVKIVIDSPSKVRITPVWDIILPIYGVFIIYSMYAFIFLYAVYAIFVQFFKNRKNMPLPLKRRFIKFVLGYLFLLLGLLYWLIPFFIPITNFLLFQISGHIIWLIAPIVFYSAFVGE